MGVLIAHAVHDEDGTITGRVPGDQDGREITLREWYERDGRWAVVLRCKNRDMAICAADVCTQIATTETYGYSQVNRWDGYLSIVAHAGVIEAGSGDLDCSTLCLASYMLAGITHARSGSTHSMEASLLATGLFIALRDERLLRSGDHAKTGDLYLAPGHHVMMVLEDGPLCDMFPDEPEPEEAAPEQAATTKPVRWLKSIRGTVRVRETPQTGATFYILSYGEVAEILDQDPATKWYKVRTPKGVGWCTWKPRYVAVVEV